MLQLPLNTVKHSWKRDFLYKDLVTEHNQWNHNPYQRNFAFLPWNDHIQVAITTLKQQQQQQPAIQVILQCKGQINKIRYPAIYQVFFLHGWTEIQNYSLTVEKYFTSECYVQVKYFSTGDEKSHISKQPCNILFII